MHYPTIIVHRNLLFREGLAGFFDNTPFRVIASVSHILDYVPSAASQQQRSLLLVDHVGEESLARFKEGSPSSRIVMLAEQPDGEGAISAFRAGANAYLADLPSGDALVKSLELVMAGATVFPFEILSRILNSSPRSVSAAEPSMPAATTMNFTRLSRTEIVILAGLAQGSSNKVIARSIDAAEATVKVHVKSILRKLQVQNRTQAAVWALAHGAGASSPSREVASEPADTPC